MTIPARIRQSDIERALRAAKNIASDGKITIDLQEGKIHIMLGQSGQADDSAPNPWDRELEP